MGEEDAFHVRSIGFQHLVRDASFGVHIRASVIDFSFFIF